MTTMTLTPTPRQRFYGNNNAPLVKGLLFTYAAGTTTKIPSYKSSTGLSLNSNPIEIDSRGECDLWIPPNVAYKYTLAPAGDTDPPTNPIFTIDQIVNSQLITLYGGVDTGIANAYVLTFVANFSAYQDGIVIYWIPAHSNTGASTMNVNGLGVVPIVDQSGVALTSSQIVANTTATIMYRSGSFTLLSNGVLGAAGPVLVGSFTPTWSGFAIAPTTIVHWQRLGSLVTLNMEVSNRGTSNSNAMSFNNLPSAIQPFTGGGSRNMCMLVDNGAEAPGTFQFGLTGIMNFALGLSPPNLTGFNAGAVTKGFPDGATLVYSL